MHAVQIHGYGGPEVMVVNEAVVAPVAAAGEVLVAVHAASINPFDVKVRDGVMRSMKELAFPAILGGDLAGIVAAIGEDVTGFTIGQEVYGAADALSSHGSLAEFSLVVASQLAPKPKTVDFQAAAALPLVASSAYQALVDTLQLQAGQKILIHGGGGGIGSVAIQLAKHLGAHVATTASAQSADFVRALGADEVIDYHDQDFSTVISDYDAVFDTVGGDTYTNSYKVLKKGGQLVSMMQDSDTSLEQQYSVTATHIFTDISAERLVAIAQLVDDGAIKVSVDKVFPLEETAQAMEYQKSGHPAGKVVIAIA